jgi:hypothetical protein
MTPPLPGWPRWSRPAGERGCIGCRWQWLPGGLTWDTDELPPRFTLARQIPLGHVAQVLIMLPPLIGQG